MGTILASAIINSAAFTLQDAANNRWSRTELFGYVNDGCRDLCVVKPDAFVLNAPLQLVSGPKQSVPADGAAFVRLSCNLGTGGLTRGRAPRMLDLAVLDRQNPNWQAAAASAAVAEYGLDPRDPKRFYVSPPQPATSPGWVEIVYSAAPPDLPNEASAIVLDDVYKTALEHYVVYRAYLKEGEFSNNAGALAHRAEFLALLGAKESGETKAGA